jgi:transcriptional regulator with XRE-family HTH domain
MNTMRGDPKRPTRDTRPRMPIKDTVKKLRMAAGMTRQDLANRAGLSMAAVTQLERGVNYDPRLSTLLALAHAFGVGVEELVRHEKPEPKERPRKKGGK